MDGLVGQGAIQISATLAEASSATLSTLQGSLPDLGHADGALRECLLAPDGLVLKALPPVQQGL